ncbi:type-F conjugative transfer system pilin assembly protein TrbC [Providencia sp. wls1919]|nr:type-F conjugative transfer system pilin assembly protein TrbC [Providencia sp. wls1919]
MNEIQAKTALVKNTNNKRSLGAYYFVSFSIPDKALISMLYDASKFGINPVIAGMHENDMKATTDKILNIIIDSGGVVQGLDINPILYTKYNISSVPALVVYCENGFDIIRGNVRIKEALNEIRVNGDCKDVATNFLKETENEN